jgi:DNA-binding transcriptional ArsR family regulator
MTPPNTNTPGCSSALLDHLGRSETGSGGRRTLGQTDHYLPLKPKVYDHRLPRYRRCMSMNSVEPHTTASERTGLDAAVALFHSLSDPTRLAITRRLAHGEARVVDLTRGLGLPQSTVSSHVACLRDCGLVMGRAEGRQMFYSLTRPELMDLFAAAETLLAATGNAVALCPTYGTTAGASAEETTR